MTFVSGTVSLSSNFAKDLMELYVHPNMTAAGFTYVEELTTSGTQRVYKSPVASNGVGDWYLSVHRAANNSTSISFAVSEDYDSTGHLMKKFAPMPGSVTASQTLPADFSHYTTAGVAPSTLTHTNFSLDCATATFLYMISFNTKRCVITTRSTANRILYAGLYEPTLPGLANHFPLMIASNTSTGSPSTCSYSREMGTTTSAAADGNGAGTFTTRFDTGALAGYSLTSPVYATDGYLSKPTVARLYCEGSSLKTSKRGLLYGMYGGVPAAWAYNDTANITWGGTSITGACILSAGTNALIVDQAF